MLYNAKLWTKLTVTTMKKIVHDKRILNYDAIYCYIMDKVDSYDHEENCT